MPMENTDLAKTFYLFQGYHVIEWIYEISIPIAIHEPLSISYIKIEGVNQGSADSCLKCPNV